MNIENVAKRTNLKDVGGRCLLHKNNNTSDPTMYICGEHYIWQMKTNGKQPCAEMPVYHVILHTP